MPPKRRRWPRRTDQSKYLAAWSVLSHSARSPVVLMEPRGHALAVRVLTSVTYFRQKTNEVKGQASGGCDQNTASPGDGRPTSDNSHGHESREEAIVGGTSPQDSLKRGKFVVG